MGTPKHPQSSPVLLPPRHFPRSKAAFSLVEVALAIGIVATVIVVLIGLFPSGLSTFRQAMNTSVGGQIAQQILSEAQQTDFDVLTDAKTNPNPAPYFTFLKPDRYFDEQGSEVIPASTAILSTSEKQRIVYWVRTRVSPKSDLPGTGPTTVNMSTLATVVVQIANNPGNQALAVAAGAATDSASPMRLLWSGSFQSDAYNTKSVQNILFSTHVARNK